MKIQKEYLDFYSGFIRWNNGFEVNWHLNCWALPIGFTNEKYVFAIDLLCFTFFFPRK